MYPIVYVNAVISRKIPLMLVFEPQLYNFYTVTVLTDVSTFSVMQQYETETGILEKVRVTTQKNSLRVHYQVCKCSPLI
jgi:hypothetical protein